MALEIADKTIDFVSKVHGINWKDPWIYVGFVGQLAFTARFVLQWIVSERLKRSVIPVEFWFLSLIGTVIVLAYALYRVDPVFILAYSFNSLVYVRNLMLIRGERKAAA